MMAKGKTLSFEAGKDLGLVNEILPADTFW